MASHAILACLFIAFILLRLRAISLRDQALALLHSTNDGQPTSAGRRTLEHLLADANAVGTISVVVTCAAWIFILYLTYTEGRRAAAQLADQEEENQKLHGREEELARALECLESRQSDLTEALEYAENQKTMQEHASRRFQSLFEGLPVGCMTFDAQGTVFEWNKLMSEIMDMPPHNAILHPLYHGMRIPDRPEVCEEILRKTFGEGQEVEIEWTFSVAGSERIVRGRFFPLRNSEGAILGGIGCVVDSTEEVTNQKLLFEMAELQKAVLNSAEYSIVWADELYRIIGMNRAAEEMLGYSADQVVDKMTLSRFHLQSELELRRAELANDFDIEIEGPNEALCYHAARGDAREEEWQYVRADGTTLDVALSVSVLRSASGEIRGYLAIAQDITEEKATAERLKMLSMVAEKSMSSVLILDSSGHILFANPAFEHTSGFMLADVMGQTPISFRTGADTDMAEYQRLLEALRQKTSTKSDLLLRRPDGSEYWSRIAISPVFGESGICQNIVIIEEDITEQKRTDLKVAESEKRFRDVVEAAGEYIWEVDRDFRFVYVSNKIEQVLGYTAEEAMGHSPLDFLEREELERLEQLVSASLLDGEPVKNIVVKSIGKFGQTVWQKFNAIPLMDESGHLQGFRGTGLDITEQKMAEDALAAANQRVKRILESINDSFYSLDKDGRFTYINSSAAANANAEVSEIIGQHIWDLHPDKFWLPLREVFDNVKETGRPANLEFAYPPSASWLEFRVYPNADGGISVFYQDVTERVNTQRQIEENLAELNEAHIQLEMQQAQLQDANQKLMNLASTDGLTGLKNHKTFQEFLADKILVAERTGIDVGVVLMDVDKFKLFNDGFGHLAGDEVLKKVARTLQRCVRDPHLVARYGGEEFVIVGVGLNEEELCELADECRMCIEDQDWKHRDVTASFGVAMWHADLGEKAEVIQRADEALYASKEGGRNRVTRWTSELRNRAA